MSVFRVWAAVWHTGVCTLSLVACVSVGAAQESVAVHKEPRHHLVLDSVRFRVLDVQIPPGDTTLFHTHSTAILYVDLSSSTVRLQVLGGAWTNNTAAASRSTIGNVRVDSSYPQRPLTHRVANVGTSLFRLLAVTSSGPAAGSAADTVHELPGTTQFRSTWYQVARVSIAGGAPTDWHTSATPVLVVQPLAAMLDVEVERGARRRLAGAGDWMLVPSRSRYRIVNAGTAPASAVTIQVR